MDRTCKSEGPRFPVPRTPGLPLYSIVHWETKRRSGTLLDGSLKLVAQRSRFDVPGAPEVDGPPVTVPQRPEVLACTPQPPRLTPDTPPPSGSVGRRRFSCGPTGERVPVTT